MISGHEIVSYEGVKKQQVNDDLTNIQSQFKNDFSEYAFIVNITSIRTFKGYNMVWFTVYETKGL